MTKTLTLIAQKALTIDDVQATLGEYLSIHRIEHHTQNKRVYHVICAPNTQLNQPLRETLYTIQCDFALQDTQRKPKRLFISDMDATMVIGETIDELADTLGIQDKISTITNRAMQGELDFKAALKERLALMKGIDKATVLSVATNVQLTRGSEALLETINEKGIDSCLVSGGFSEFTQQVSGRLGFKQHKANQLSYDENQQLDGKWKGELVDATTKANTLKQMATQNGIALSETIAVGDGANDKLMIEAAGLGVAYYGKPILRTVANAEIHCGNMQSLIYFI